MLIGVYVDNHGRVICAKHGRGLSLVDGDALADYLRIGVVGSVFLLGPAGKAGAIMSLQMEDM